MGRVRHQNLQILEASGLGIQEGHRLIAIEGIEMPGASTVLIAVEHCCAASTYSFDVWNWCTQQYVISWEMWPTPWCTKKWWNIYTPEV